MFYRKVVIFWCGNISIKSDLRPGTGPDSRYTIVTSGFCCSESANQIRVAANLAERRDCGPLQALIIYADDIVFLLSSQYYLNTTLGIAVTVYCFF